MFWAGRAWTNNGLKDFNKAISDANEAIRLKNDFALPYMERGLAHYSVKDYDLALNDLDRVIKLQPTKAEALFYRGLTLVAQKKLGEAIKAFTDTIQINPKHAAAYKERAACYESLGQTSQAASDREQAQRLNPGLGQPTAGRPNSKS
jgi:tetratricopeptide (TPR) repeat protein